MKSLFGHSNSRRLKPGINVLLSLFTALTFSFVITTDIANVTTDVFQDAIIAGSGTVTYEANTNVAGVLSFDRSQQHWVNMNALQDDLDGKSRSVFMWVKAEDNTTTNQALFAVNSSGGDNLSFMWIDDSGDNLEVNRGGTINESASFSMGGGVWYYVGWSYDHTSGETVVYVNGIENDRFTTGTSVPDLNAQYSLGQEFDGGNTSDFYNGDMAEISVWDEVLTPVEIRAAMRAKITNTHTAYDHLVGYYSIFGEYTDDMSVLKDHSGKGNDGTFQNGMTQDFKNVQSIEGFNAISWYEHFSWKKDGAEVSTANTFTTDVVAGNYEFIATRNFVQSTDTWSMTLNSNAATVDNIADETLCEDAPVTRSVPANTVNYLDFERSEGNSIALNSLSEDLKNTDYSVFLWVKKESFISNGDFYQLLAFQDSDTETTSRFYITGSERVTLWDGSNFFQSPVGLSNDTWYFVGFTFNTTSKEIKLYINDNDALTSTALDLTITDNWLATLGARYIDNGLTNYLDGQLAEITIWDKVLSKEEIDNLRTTAPAHNTANLVAAYGALPNIADNTLRDLTGNGHDGVASHESIIVDDSEESIPNYDASAYQTFSWKKNGVEFDTDANATITVEEGSYNYTVAYGSELFPKTENFTLDYTELLPTAPTDQTGAVGGSVTFSVDNIPGATYQWFKNTEGINNVTTSNGLGSNVVNQVLEHNGVIYAATQEGLSISRDGGISFVNKTTADGLKDNRIVSIVFDDNGTLYIGYHKTGVDGFTISTDGGETFVSKNIPGVSSQRTRLFHKSSSNNVWTAIENGAGGNLVKISNNGNNVTTYSLPSTPILVFQSGNGLFTVDNRNRLNLSQTSKPSTILVTRDTDNGLPNSNPVRSDFLIANDNYYMTFRGDESIDDELGLYISYGGSTNFKRRTTSRGLGDNSCNSVMISNGVLYVGTDGGVSYSDDDGVSFSTISTTDGLIDNHVNHVFESNGVLYIATDGGLSIKRDLTVLVDNPDANAANRIQGATGPELTVSNLNLGEDGSEYYAVVTLGDCSRQTNTVELSVLEAPVITSTTPANNATDITLDSDISITFSEPIASGSGNIIIRNAADNSQVESISVANATINGAVLTINPSTDLGFAETYTIELEAGIVNGIITSQPNLAVSEAVRFTTVCPGLILTQPMDQTGAIGGNATFSVPEVSGASYTWYGKNDSWEDLGTIIDRYGLFVSTTDILAKDGVLYASTQEGLFISENMGDDWTQTDAQTAGFANTNRVRDVFVSGDDVYVATGAGLSVSGDRGVSWSTILVGNGLDYTEDQGLYTVLVSGGKIYAGTDKGLFVSSNNGASWTSGSSSTSGFQSDNSVTDVYVSGNTIYAITTKSIWASDDGGISWNTTNSGENGFQLGDSDLITDLYAEGNTLYITTSYSEGPLFSSVDGGETWTAVDLGFPDLTSLQSVFIHDDVIYAAKFDLLISEDEATSWIEVSDPNLYIGGAVMGISVDNGRVYVITIDGDVYSLELFAPLGDESDNTASNQIQGASTHELTINNLTEDFNETEYFVEVTKATCLEYSNLVTLTVTDGVVDVTPPADPIITGISDDTGISNSDGITTDQNILVYGTAEPNSTIEVSTQFGPLRNTTADANGDWVLDIQDITLVQIVTNFTAVSVDGAGNRSGTSNTFVLTPDFTAPADPVITGISDDTGVSDSDGITSDQNILIMGTAEPNATVEVSSQFGPLRNTTADANGDWVLDIQDITLVQVITNFTAETIDLAGNRSGVSNTFVLTPDFTAPAKPAITGISDDTGVSNSDGITSDQNILVYGTAEPNSTVEISTQFGPLRNTTSDANGDWELDIQDITLVQIVTHFTAEAVDPAGNRSATSDAFTLTPDFTAPDKPVITGISDDTGSSNSDGITNDKHITISGTAEANATVEISSQFGPLRNTTADVNGDWVLDITDITLIELTVSLTAEAVDEAGNRSATSDVFVLTPDFTAPGVTISIENSSAGGYTITALFDEEVTGLSLGGLTITGGTASSLTQNTTRSYSFFVSLSGSTVDIQVDAGAAQDVAGNDNTVSNQLTLGLPPNAVKEGFTNLSETLRAEVVNLYPNPASSILTIDMSELSADEVDISLYNMAGIPVFTREAYSKRTLKLDVSSWTSGMYIVQLYDGTRVFRKKVMVKK